MKLYEYTVGERMLGKQILAYLVYRIDWKGNYSAGPEYEVGDDAELARAMAERDAATLNGISNQ